MDFTIFYVTLQEKNNIYTIIFNNRLYTCNYYLLLINKARIVWIID